MSIPPRTGPTAFVLAGGGTKGSFEVGVLQYLIGVERIVPEIVTATSAGAIAAAVLAQARTLDEFAQRVDEIEGDVLAMTSPERVFGKQEWLTGAKLKSVIIGTSIRRRSTTKLLASECSNMSEESCYPSTFGVPGRCCAPAGSF